MRAFDLRANELSDPLGLEERRPRLSWRCEDPCVAGLSAELRAAASRAELDDSGTLLWQCPPAAGTNRSCAWPGEPLADRQRVWWQVRIHDAAGAPGPWSAPGFCEAGLADAAWEAAWVDAPGVRSPFFRCRLTPQQTGAPQRARLYLAAAGFVEAHCNGSRLGDAVLFPPPGDFTREIATQTFDLGALLRPGRVNVVGIILAGGWFERFGWGRRCLRCRIELEWADGTRQVAGTEAGSWQAADGPWRREDPYDGEWYDARLTRPGWDDPEHAIDDDGWLACGRGFATRGAEAPGGRMVGLISEPIQVLARFAPVAIQRPAENRLLLDAGENLAGWLALHVSAPAGCTLSVRYAEGCDGDELDLRPNFGAAAEDRYTAAGHARETWEPRFALHGFRYAMIQAPPTVLDGLEVEICRVGSAVAAAATFTCANAVAATLFAMCQRTVANNLQGVLTDCPQRDERQGWLGDAHAIGPTVLSLFAALPFYRRWLRVIDQTQDSATGIRWSDQAPPFPRMLRRPITERSWWRLDEIRAREPHGDLVYTVAGTLIPWQVYQASADQRILATAWPGILRHCQVQVARPAWPLGSTGRHADHAERTDCRSLHAPTSAILVNSALLVEELRLAARIGEIVDHHDSAAWLAAKAGEATVALRCACYDQPTAGHTQTALAFALHLGLARDAAEHRTFSEALAADVIAHDHHLTPGIIGMPYLLEALGSIGRRDLAWEGIMIADEPGWTWMIRKGMTTIHEHRTDRWPMTSQNHPANAVIASWLIRWLVGLRFDERQPGCRLALIDPGIAIQVADAGIHLDTIAGPWRLVWRRDAEGVAVDVSVPAGACALLHPEQPWCQPPPDHRLSPGHHQMRLVSDHGVK